MKKALKMFLAAIMVLGMIFAVSNFIAIGKAAASTKNGSWVYMFGETVCIAPGNECSTVDNGFPDD